PGAGAPRVPLARGDEKSVVGNVTFGLGLFPTEPPRRMVELTRLAEDLGFGCVYIGDSQMIWREAYVILGAAAMATSRITLAPGGQGGRWGHRARGDRSALPRGLTARAGGGRGRGRPRPPRRGLPRCLLDAVLDPR